MKWIFKTCVYLSLRTDFCGGWKVDLIGTENNALFENLLLSSVISKRLKE